MYANENGKPLYLLNSVKCSLAYIRLMSLWPFFCLVAVKKPGKTNVEVGPLLVKHRLQCNVLDIYFF